MELQNIPMKISYKSKEQDDVLENFIIPEFKGSIMYKRSVRFFHQVFLNQWYVEDKMNQ